MKTPSEPLWGPYAKKYPGISRIVDEAAGVRWDCTVFPGLYRGPLTVPSHLWESGFSPLWAAPDQSAHAYAFEFPAWVQGVRAEIAYRIAGPTAAEFSAEFANSSDRERRLSLHLASTIALPWLERRHPVAAPASLALRASDQWLPGAAHISVRREKTHFRQGLPYDAILPGEQAVGGAVGGHALCWANEMVAGAELVYRAPTFPGERRVYVRVRLRGARPATLRLRRGTETFEQVVDNSLDWTWRPLGEAFRSGEEFALTCLGNPDLELNGFAFTRSKSPPVVQPCKWSPYPLESRLLAPHARAFCLGGPESDRWFGMAWKGAEGRWRDVLASELEAVLPPASHNHISGRLEGQGEGCFTAAFLSCVPVPPGGETKVAGVFAHGSLAEVKDALGRVGGRGTTKAMARARASYAAPAHATPDETARARLRATLMTNVVFPVRRFDGWIRHRCPGKWWDCLYTWDSGMTGLGLLELDPALAIEALDHYLCAPHEPAAFVHHGSLVPTQIWLAREIWNRTHDRTWLRRVLPGLRRYYRYYSGRGEGSTLASLGSGLLRPWDYFYNSGGWDDYPPQKHVWSDRTGELARRVAPVSTTAYALLFARQLAALEHAADEAPNATGEKTSDRLDLNDDIARFVATIAQTRDAETGFHGYMVHDEQGRPSGLLRHASGQNFNLGLDGALPLVAWACESKDAEQVLRALFDPRRLWTPIGLGTVDKSAAYHSDDGYWNGMVWLPYQWLFFKALLDRCEAGLAVRLARAAANVFSQATAETGRCYEHFIPAGGQGAGWHHFGGLSAPWMALDAALNQPGRLTGGLDFLPLSDDTSKRGERRVTFRRSLAGAAAALLLVQAKRPTVRLDRTPLEVTEQGPELWAIELPAGLGEGSLVIA